MIFLEFNHWIELFHTTAKNLTPAPTITAPDDSSHTIQINVFSIGKRRPRGRANWQADRKSHLGPPNQDSIVNELLGYNSILDLILTCSK